MGRAVARRHRGKGTGAGVGRGRARGRLEPGRAPGAARAARLSRAPGNSVPRDVGRGGGHSAAARLDRRHLLNTQLTPAERETLYAYVERGGVVLATQVQGNKFFPLFGIASATTSRTNFRVSFATAATADAALRYLNRPEEQTVSLGDPKLYSETGWFTEYTVTTGTQVLARYENGTAALTLTAFVRGLA